MNEFIEVYLTIFCAIISLVYVVSVIVGFSFWIDNKLNEQKTILPVRILCVTAPFVMPLILAILFIIFKN